MEPLALLLSLFAPDVGKLGADEWAVREAETRRCDCFLLALFLPEFHEDPEVNHRLQWLHRRNGKWTRLDYVERCVMRADLCAWVRIYLIPGRSRLDRTYEAFEALHTDRAASDALFAAWRPKPGENEVFLRGTIVAGEFDRYLEHLDYHRGIAPAPRPLETCDPKP